MELQLLTCQVSGDGLQSGQETIVFAGAGVDGTPASNGATVSAFSQDVNIPCIASNQVKRRSSDVW